MERKTINLITETAALRVYWENMEYLQHKIPTFNSIAFNRLGYNDINLNIVPLLSSHSNIRKHSKTQKG